MDANETMHAETKPLIRTTPTPVKSNKLFRDRENLCWMAILGLTAILVYAYWNSYTSVFLSWGSAQYSHGWLIPLFAVVLIWLRRESFGDVSPAHRWCGVGILTAGIGSRVIFTFLHINTFDRMTLIVSLMGVFVLVGGLKTIRWAGPAILFLVFMLPMPTMVERGIIIPLKSRVATPVSVFALETIGIDTYREGNVIHVGRHAMEVADACSGLRMLTIFIAISFAMAMIINNRPMWERFLIVLSAIPIALAVNIIRITVTGIFYNFSSDPNAGIGHLIHHIAGFAMPVLALGFLYLELEIFSRIFIDAPENQFVPIAARANRSPTPHGPRKPR